MNVLRILIMSAALALIGACASTPPNPNPLASAPFPAVDVNLARYMGRWYNIANIPYFGERGYVGSFSEWSLRPDGQIDDAYIGRKGGFAEPQTRKDFVDTIVPNTGNAEWKVHLFGPITVTQLTVYVDPEYRYTLLGYPGKSLGWVFSRTPDMDDATYAALLEKMKSMGYDISQFKRVPHRPEDIGRTGYQSPGDPS